MDVKNYLILQASSMRELEDATFQGLTDEQLGWIPPGTANPIGLTALHMISSMDYFLSVLTGKPRLWDAQGWKGQFNLAEPPGYGDDWSTFRHGTVTVEGLKSYQVVVRVELDFYLQALTPEELDRRVKFFSDSDPVAAVVALLFGHWMLHAGEIAALKGVYGTKGLPF
jgi:hypothetical protein